MTMVTANRNYMGNQFKGTCNTPPTLKGLPLANLTYESLPTCREESEDLLAVMQAGFNTNIDSIVQVNEQAMDNLENTAYEINNNLNIWN